ncbi:membrane metalloprotease [Rasiella rasia]|uniref:Membrane metalloprotease n=1 Tax=Rasiella rasia TaxID=2744027 RepID=A0A6G6GKE8_9FLAO|nr:membrane metalloprotease [Rasiella rasia]QIE59066.1 membrane metalloprotease [Rasiella rasia]
MKTYFSKLLLLLAFSVILTACKKDDDASENDDRSENLLGLGQSAEDLLSDDIYKTLVVEIVYSNGFRPEQETIDNLRTFLNQRVNKPGGVQIVETVISPPEGAPYTTQEIRDIESTHRTRYTNGDEIAVYVFFANGNASGDTASSVTLGTAYRNTSVVIYQETLQSLQVDRFLVEATTLRHEFGHLFGLINILDDDIHPTNHEDPDSNKHCVVEDCLMYFASTIPSTLPNPTAADIPTLDPLCIADLQAKGGK